MEWVSSGFKPLDSLSGGFVAGRINTLLYDTQAGKGFILSRVVSSALKRGVAVYIDLDTYFTYSLESGLEGVERPENLVVFAPKGAGVEEVVVSVASARLEDVKLIVFDSATAFYHIYDETPDFSRLNRKLNLYLTLLLKAASEARAPLIVTSMLKPQRLRGGQLPSYAGGRGLERRSVLILSLRSFEGWVEVSVVKHPRREVVGGSVRLEV